MNGETPVNSSLPTLVPTDEPEHSVGEQGAMVTRADLDMLYHKLQMLNDVFKSQQEKINVLENFVAKATQLTEQLYKYVGNLQDRVLAVETRNLKLPSTYSERAGRAVGNAAEALRVVTVANASTPHPSTGLRTPVTAVSPATGIASASDTTPRTPHSSALLSPETPSIHYTPGGRRRSQTYLNKRAKHDLAGKIPPTMAQIPVIPITDIELIVFFFNSTSRPLVALRLYARQWGPAEITNVLNDHRDISPDGYQRNTCSVKLTTSIGLGRKEGGQAWETSWRQFFTNADDAAATDAIRLEGKELQKAQEYNVLGLLRDLKKFPGVGMKGIFTDSVQWCAENNLDIPISEIHKVAIALQNNMDPAKYLNMDADSISSDGSQLDADSDVVSEPDSAYHPEYSEQRPNLTSETSTQTEDDDIRLQQSTGDSTQ